MKSFRLVITVLLSGLVWVAGAGGSAAACSCVQITDTDAFDSASDVFVARVQDIDDSREYRQNGDVESSDDFIVRYAMEVDGVFKGTALDTQVVTTGQRGGGCGAEMSLLGSYLVFARRSGDVITTSLCSGNRSAGVPEAERLFGVARPPEASVAPEVSPTAGTAAPPDAVVGDAEVPDTESLGEQADDRGALVYAAAVLAAMIGLAAAGVVLGRRARQRGDVGTTMEP